MTPNDLAPQAMHPADMLLLAAPAALLTAAIATLPRRLTAPTVWHLARCAAGAALAVAIAAAVALVWPHGFAIAPLRSTIAQHVVMPAITLIGLVIVRFASRYVASEPEERRFARWLLLTLAGATFVVASDHLLMLTLGWIATSLALQRLLTFYPDRPMARLAAQEKFVVSRIADGCMLTAIALLGSTTGSLRLSELITTATAAPLPSEARAALVLVAAAALLKCAQLPFHGWLLRVMEAPTPVSALLHAGVVNLGGLVMIRMWPLLEGATGARWLLVIGGGSTAAIAALAGSTQVAAKAALAWSTSAQMGFMLLQCGLGLPEMALLHLIAHSAYKAHAFLTANSTVRENAVDALAPAPVTGGILARTVATIVGMLIVAVAAWTIGVDLTTRPELLAVATMVAFAMVPMLLPGQRPGPLGWVRGSLCAALIAGLWCALHRLAHAALAIDNTAHSSSPALAIAALATFAPLLAVRIRLADWPDGRGTAQLHHICHRGLFLDEWFTRLVQRLRRPSSNSPGSVSIAHFPPRSPLRGEL